MADVPQAADRPVVPPPQQQPPDAGAAARNDKNRAAETVKAPHPDWSKTDTTKSSGRVTAEPVKTPDLSTKAMPGAEYVRGIQAGLTSRPESSARPERPITLTGTQLGDVNERNRAAESVKEPHPGWRTENAEQLKAKQDGPTSLTVDQARSLVHACLPDRNAVNDFRAYLRANPGEAMKTGDMRTANALLEFAKLGPDKRDVQPSPRVDRAIHMAVGVADGKYVSQGTLDDLARTTRDTPDALRARGLSKEDVNEVAGFLSRTGRESTTPTDKERLVVGGEEWHPRTPAEHVQHQRMEAIQNVTESPLTVSISKFLGLSDMQAYAAGRMASLLTDMAGAHLGAVGHRGGGVDARAGERNQAEVRPQEGAPVKRGPEVKPEAWMNAPRQAPKDVRVERPLRTGEGEVPRAAPRGDQNGGRPEPAAGQPDVSKAPDLKPGISLNETREEPSRVMHFPDASPTTVKQPGVDWVQGGSKIETAHATAKGTEVRQTIDGGTWIQNKRLDPEAPPGTVDAKSKGMATTSYEERISSNVKQAVDKFQFPVTRELSARSATTDGFTNTTVLKNPDGLVINLEVPGFQNLPPERQAKIQDMATESLNSFREADGNLWGKPARIQVVPTP